MQWVLRYLLAIRVYDDKGEVQMKIEIGESLIYSWLRHAKGCQIVQTNWKPSIKSWELQNEEMLQSLMEQSSILFQGEYEAKVFKGNSSLSQQLIVPVTYLVEFCNILKMLHEYFSFKRPFHLRISWSVIL